MFAFLQVFVERILRIAILPEIPLCPYIADIMIHEPERKEDTAIAELHPFTRQTTLTGYYPVPREVLNRSLPPTAILLYAILLDRATLSRKNGWTDETGRVYVVYPIEKLAETLHVSETAVKRYLSELEADGLIERQRPVGNGPSHIFVNIPEESRSTAEGQPNAPSESAKTPRPTGQKRTTNNRRKQEKLSDSYYQHKEDESL